MAAHTPLRSTMRNLTLLIECHFIRIDVSTSQLRLKLLEGFHYANKKPLTLFYSALVTPYQINRFMLHRNEPPGYSIQDAVIRQNFRKLEDFSHTKEARILLPDESGKVVQKYQHYLSS